MARQDSLQKLQQVLLKRQEALQRAIAGDLSLLSELRQQGPGDAADFALDAARDELNLQLAEVESRELVQIDKALQQMEAGHYGDCEHCGQPIPLARLQALPYAAYCIRCQRELEETGELEQDESRSRAKQAIL